MSMITAIFPLLGLLIMTCSGQSPVVSSQISSGQPVDMCLPTGIQDLVSTLNTKYPKLEPISSALNTSRLLYERLFAPYMDLASVLKDYCSIYEQKRLVIDRCRDSDAKDIAVNGFSLADDICLNRLDDYQKNLLCVVSVKTTPCQPLCSQYEAGSHAYLNASSQTIPDGDMQTLMTADCRYLNCETNCTRPLIENQCKGAGNLEATALSAVFAGQRVIYGRSQQRIPPECLQMITIVRSADTVPVSINGSATTVVMAGNGSMVGSGSGMTGSGNNGTTNVVTSVASGSSNGSLGTVGSDSPNMANSGAAVAGVSAPAAITSSNGNGSVMVSGSSGNGTAPVANGNGNAASSSVTGSVGSSGNGSVAAPVVSAATNASAPGSSAAGNASSAGGATVGPTVKAAVVSGNNTIVGSGSANSTTNGTSGASSSGNGTVAGAKPPVAAAPSTNSSAGGSPPAPASSGSGPAAAPAPAPAPAAPAQKSGAMAPGSHKIPITYQTALAMAGLVAAVIM